MLSQTLEDGALSITSLSAGGCVSPKRGGQASGRPSLQVTVPQATWTPSRLLRAEAHHLICLKFRNGFRRIQNLKKK